MNYLTAHHYFSQELLTFLRRAVTILCNSSPAPERISALQEQNLELKKEAINESTISCDEGNDGAAGLLRLPNELELYTENVHVSGLDRIPSRG